MTPTQCLRSLGYRLYMHPTGCYDVWIGEGPNARMLGNWSAEEVEAEEKRLKSLSERLFGEASQS